MPKPEDLGLRRRALEAVDVLFIFVNDRVDVSALNDLLDALSYVGFV
jgi:hypothetical protein